MTTLLQHRSLDRFVRFGLVGASSIVINTAVLWALVVGVPVLLGSVLAAEVAILSNSLINDRWTFRTSAGPHAWPQWLLRFSVVVLGGIVITAALFSALTSYGHLSLLLSNLVAMLIGLAYPLANVIAVPVAFACNYLLIARWRSVSLPVRTTAQLPLVPRPSAATAQPETVHRIRGRLVRVCAALAMLLALGWVIIDPPGVWGALAVLLNRIRGRLVRVCAALAMLLALGWVIIDPPGAWGALAVLLIGTALVVRPGVDRRKTTVLLLAAAVGTTTVDYLTWRLSMVNWSSWWVAVPLFIAEASGAIHTLGLQYTVWPRPKLEIRASDNIRRRRIFIFIPTVNEGPSILEPTIRGALAARAKYLATYPHDRVTIVLCNDGRVANVPNWRDVEALATQSNVACVTRTVGGGAKAGNIENARQQVGATGDALVVIFDADQIAEPDFLLKTVPPFADPSIGWVQTGQYYRNLANPVARWSNDQQALFYQLLCPGKAAQNAAFICGTNVVLRAAALDEIGGLPQDSVTEDFAASIALHPRWRSLFLTDVLARGLGPMDLKSYFSQQRRWAIGTIGVLRSHWREIVLPKRGGLRLEQRLQYALACTHYLCGLRDLIYLVAPLIFLFTGVSAVHGANLESFLWHFLPYWIISQVAFWHVAWGKTSLRGIVIGFGSFPVLIGSLLTVVRGRRIGFAVTAKQRASASTWRHLRPHLLGALACLLGVVWAVRAGNMQGAIVISVLWVVYTLLMLGGMAWLGLLDQRAAGDVQRSLGRVTQQFRAIRARSLAWAWQPALGWARSWMFAGMLVVALGGALVSHNVVLAQPVAFKPQQELGRPYLGVSLPFELIGSAPNLERELGRSFAIVGRTQDIHDRFDERWAKQLAAAGARPWVTLLFGVDKPSLDSSLPAIANGVHDDALRAWAQGIREYGQPVYLTILPHVDRNWSISSAVANNGIPQDVPRAWQHVQSIFAQEGARNVAWVWAPADPTADQAYAPPAATIDVTLMSLISYPGARWAEPAKALVAAKMRYPNTPLFIEVSAAGPAEQKAAWLRAVGAAIKGSKNVHALLYHEGGPDPHASESEQHAWSLASDPQTTQALQEAAVQAALQTSALSQGTTR